MPMRRAASAVPIQRISSLIAPTVPFFRCVPRISWFSTRNRQGRGEHDGMPDADLLTPPRQAAGGDGRARPLRRRRALPSGRAVAGGLLVALALIGIYAAYTGATAPPRRSYVVAAHDIAVGSRLEPKDLTV